MRCARRRWRAVERLLICRHDWRRARGAQSCAGRNSRSPPTRRVVVGPPDFVLALPGGSFRRPDRSQRRRDHELDNDRRWTAFLKPFPVDPRPDSGPGLERTTTERCFLDDLAPAHPPRECWRGGRRSFKDEHRAISPPTHVDSGDIVHRGAGHDSRLCRELAVDAATRLRQYFLDAFLDSLDDVCRRLRGRLSFPLSQPASRHLARRLWRRRGTTENAHCLGAKQPDHTHRDAVHAEDREGGCHPGVRRYRLVFRRRVLFGLG